MKARLVDVELGFRWPIDTFSGSISSRRSILVGLTEEGYTGWGEAAAFPSGVAGTPDETWSALGSWLDDPSSLPKISLARAAVEGARMDLAARSAGMPLFRRLGGERRAVPARHAVGIAQDIDRLIARVGELWATGIRFLKLKVSPGTDVEPVRALTEAFRGLDIAVDANGSYADPADPALETLDGLGVSAIEQPFPPTDLVGHKLLRERVRARVCLDESVRNVETAAMALTAGAADMISIKLGRHGWSDAVTILEQARSEGVAVRAGGTFDTAIGRLHLLAFATLPGVDDAEVAPPAGYLKADVASYPGVVGGKVSPADLPGIGVDPDIPEGMIVREANSE